MERDPQRTAAGSLWPVWKVDEAVIRANCGTGINDAYVDNQAPSIGVAGDTTRTVSIGEPLTVTIIAADDGIPGPDLEAATFSGPGASVVRVIADDMVLTAAIDVTVIVQPVE